VPAGGTLDLVELADLVTTAKRLVAAACATGADDDVVTLRAGGATRTVVVVDVDVVGKKSVVVELERCVEVGGADVLELAVSVKTSTSSSSGLDHIKTCAPLSDESRRAIVNKRYRGWGRIAVHDGRFPSRD
jgi:hypothetical protein